MHVLYSNSRIFVIPVYIFNGRIQTQVDTSGYCQRCACVVCMTSASSWPNCVSRVARIQPSCIAPLPAAAKMMMKYGFLIFLCQNRYLQAKLSMTDRPAKVAAVVESIERDLELLCLTGVEDKLQQDIRPTLEMLRNGGIKVRYGFYLTLI